MIWSLFHLVSPDIVTKDEVSQRVLVSLSVVELIPVGPVANLPVGIEQIHVNLNTYEPIKFDVEVQLSVSFSHCCRLLSLPEFLNFFFANFRDVGAYAYLSTSCVIVAPIWAMNCSVVLYHCLFMVPGSIYSVSLVQRMLPVEFLVWLLTVIHLQVNLPVRDLVHSKEIAYFLHLRIFSIATLENVITRVLSKLPIEILQLES